MEIGRRESGWRGMEDHFERKEEGYMEEDWFHCRLRHFRGNDAFIGDREMTIAWDDGKDGRKD